MPAGRPKGIPKSGGRKKGTPNKTTAAQRERFAEFVNGNFDAFIGWIKDIADDPTQGGKARAAELYLRACKFVIPELAHTALTGAEGEPLRVSIAINGILRDREGLEHAPDVGAVPRV